MVLSVYSDHSTIGLARRPRAIAANPAVPTSASSTGGGAACFEDGLARGESVARRAARGAGLAPDENAARHGNECGSVWLTFARPQWPQPLSSCVAHVMQQFVFFTALQAGWCSSPWTGRDSRLVINIVMIG